MERENIFVGNGVEIYRDNGKLYLEYEQGEAASWLVRNEITPEEAARAQRSERDALAVVLAAQQRGNTQRVQ